MTRSKWLALTVEAPILKIAELLNDHQFKRGCTVGFELVELKKDSIRGKFIEEIIDNETIIDPFGEKTLNSVRRYSIFDFLVLPLEKNRFLLRINNPPRSLKNFISILSDVLDFGFYVEPLEVDILAMIQHIKFINSAKDWSIKKIRMSQVRLSESSIAKIEVTSEGDAYQDLRDHMNVKNALLERVTIEYKEANTTSEIELTSKGLISCDISMLEELTPTFQSYFS